MLAQGGLKYSLVLYLSDPSFCMPYLNEIRQVLQGVKHTRTYIHACSSHCTFTVCKLTDYMQQSPT